jgi:hypothetical protein
VFTNKRRSQMSQSRQTSLLRILTICVAAGLAGVSNATEMYRWVVVDGKTHFGDRPPDQTAHPVLAPRGKRSQESLDRS